MCAELETGIRKIMSDAHLIQFQGVITGLEKKKSHSQNPLRDR